MNEIEVIGAEDLKLKEEFGAEIKRLNSEKAIPIEDIEILNKKLQEKQTPVTLQDELTKLENNLALYIESAKEYMQDKDITEQLDFYRHERKRCGSTTKLDEYSFFYYYNSEIVEIFNKWTLEPEPVFQILLPAISFIKYLDEKINLLVGEESDNQKIYGSIRQQEPTPPAKQGHRKPFLIKDENGNYRFADGNHDNTRKKMIQFYFYYESEITDSESNWESVVRTWINILIGADKFDISSTRNLQTMNTYLTRTAKADKDKNNAAIATTPRNAQAIEEIAALFDELGITPK